MTDIKDQSDKDIEDIKKGFYLDIQKAKDGSLVAVASTNSVDRHGEVVDNNGWDLKAYKKNPLILWAHDHSEPAIGMSAKTWIEGSGKKAQLMIKPVLHDVTDKAKAIKSLVEMGVIKSLSVGFRPLESEDGITWDKSELLEVSVVNVPANADAMMLAYKGLKDKGFKDEVIKDLGIEEKSTVEQDIKAIQETLVSLQASLDSVIDNKTKDNQNSDIETVKEPIASDPSVIRERLSMNKVIARAADKILEADKKQTQVDKHGLVKVIKRANEILTVAEKGKL